MRTRFPPELVARRCHGRSRRRAGAYADGSVLTPCRLVNEAPSGHYAHGYRLVGNQPTKDGAF
jgi:hypothetical protein